jgi:hypothetical protein
MRPNALLAILGATAILATACGEEVKRKNRGDDDDGNGGSGQTGGSGPVGPGGGGTDPQAPQFLSFAANVSTLFEGESVIFTAVVTDPNGIDDVIGGSLRDDDGNTYGAFVTSGQEGAYEMTLSWGQIQQVAPIDFPYGSARTRTFVAEFFDADGHMATADTPLDLTCSNGVAGCDGDCVDTMNDFDACGSCDTSCGDDLCLQGAFCDLGSCSGTPLDCSGLDTPCAAGTCNPANGTCQAQNLPNNTACADANACTANDSCQNGVCSGTTIVACIDADGCCPGNCTPFNDTDCGNPVIYSTGFEGVCPNGWTLSGDWECGAPINVGPLPFAGTKCIATQIDGNYNDNQSYATANAQSPPISLAGTVSPQATFRMWIQTEGASFDGANLKVSTNGGATWQLVTGVTPAYNATVAGESAWNGDQSAAGWQLVTANLTPYAGQNILLRFSFRTDGSVVAAGVYVDEFSVAD